MTENGNRQWLLAGRPEGTPTAEHFELVERPVPGPAYGEVLVRTRYLSVDPYMRGRMRDEQSYADPWVVGEPLHGGVVGDVVESNHPAFEPGAVVTGRLDWAEYAVADGEALTPVDPDLAPVSTALGVLGMPGRTAYFGMLDVARPKPGDTAVISAAAGAVGSVAGQIARLAGCRVVGIAGSDEKIDFLTDELGFDAGVNYKTATDLDAEIAAACPDGVDVYFENVGGRITDAIMAQLNERGRVAVCGKIALYNDPEPPLGPRFMHQRYRARVEGFLVFDYEPRYPEANERLARWVRDGDLTYRETVTEGIENAPEAFIGLFEGANVGKQLVAVAPDEG